MTKRKSCAPPVVALWQWSQMGAPVAVSRRARISVSETSPMVILLLTSRVTTPAAPRVAEAAMTLPSFAEAVVLFSAMSCEATNSSPSEATAEEPARVLATQDIRTLSIYAERIELSYFSKVRKELQSSSLTFSTWTLLICLNIFDFRRAIGPPGV